MTIAAPELRPRWSFRLGLIFLTAASVSLPMAWISLAKILLFVSSLWYLVVNIDKHRSESVFLMLWTPRIVLVIIAAFALSLAWTHVDLNFALAVLVKHAKLLEIILIVSLIRTFGEAQLSIKVFAFFQAFVMFISWTKAIGFTTPWDNNQAHNHVVFSESYIDQAIMFTVSAALFWHLRNDSLWHRRLGILLAIVLLLNVFVLLPGRTGYIVAIVAISLSLFWATSKKWQIPVIIFTPLILISSIYWGNNHAHQKLYSMLVESKDYVQHAQTESSSGWRLNAWHRSLQAISDKPLLGYGVGSWSPAVKRFEGPSATRAFGTNNSSNPHQEFLLWGVELGGVGIVLILSFLAGVALDAKHFPTGPRRAVLCILAITATASLFNSVLFDDLIGDYLVVVLGITISYGIRKTAEMEKIG